jgi:hypothetical protein
MPENGHVPDEVSAMRDRLDTLPELHAGANCDELLEAYGKLCYRMYEIARARTEYEIRNDARLDRIEACQRQILERLPVLPLQK